MERRKRRRARWRELTLALLRFIAAVALLAGCYFGVRYVFKRSAMEVAQIKDRPASDYYLIVDQPMKMTVVNDAGELAMEITGKDVRLTTDQRTAIFTGAHAVYYEGGQTSLTMDAGKIEYDTLSEDFNLTEGLTIKTKDGMQVVASEVEWRRAKNQSATARNKPPSFRFGKGVKVTSSDGNTLEALYMQADRELMYMEFLGKVHGSVAALQDTGFISERKLADVQQLQLKDFEKLGFEAEQVIYDKRNQVVLATSRYYDRAFKITDMDGNVVRIEDYQPDPQQVTFSKEAIIVRTNHLEAHIAQKWADCVGAITMTIPPSAPKANDDKALTVVRQYEARIGAEEVEYFWGRDYVLTHGRTRVEQQDRLALADQITYWGDQKMVLLDGNITVVQGSGDWLVDNQLIDVSNHDMRRAVTTYSELYGDRAVIYLNNNDFIASGSVRIRQNERETSADTIVYQNDIKRISAKGNVKFKDADGQTFLCGGLTFHNKSSYLQVEGGSSADIRLPAKYANDINRALAQMREEQPPADVSDPAVPAPTNLNPNENSALARGAPPPLPPVDSSAPAEGGQELPPLRVPTQSGEKPADDSASGPKPDNRTAPAEQQPQELTINLGESASKNGTKDSSAGKDKPKDGAKKDGK